MPTYRELMDAAANADSSGDAAGAKRLVELAQQEQSSTAEKLQTAPVPEPSGFGGMQSVYGIGTSKENLQQQGAKTGAAMARYGAPLIAGAATGGVSAIPAVTAFMGELGARGIEGKPVLSREALGEATFSAALNAIPIPAPSQAKTFLAQGTVNTIKSGLQTLGVIGGGTVAKDIIQTGKIPTTTSELKETTKKIWENAALPTVMNATLHGMGGFARSISDDLESANAQRNLLSQIGVRSPTAAALLPSKLADIEESVAASSPSIAAQREGMLSDASQSIKSQLAPKIESNNEMVSNMLEGKIGIYDEANKRYTKAVTAAEQAKNAALEAQSNINLTPEQKAQIADKTLADQYNALSEKASALFDATIGTGNISNTSLAEKVGNVVSDLFQLRRQSATSMTRNLSSMGEFIDVNNMANSAKKALGNDANTDAGKRILSTIENYAKSRSEQAPKLFDATGKAIATPSSALIDMGQFRELRDNISSALIGMSPDAAVMNKAEALASKAYGAANDALAQSISALPNGQQLLQEHNAFRNYWASTSKMLESPLGRSLYRREINDEFIGSLAGKLIKGNVDELKNLGQFADAVSSFDPNVKKVALGSIAEAVKNNLIQNNRKNGVVDWNGVAKNITEMNSVSDMGKYFDTASIGFGTPKQVQAWSAATKKFKPGDLRSDDILAALENPEFRKAISDGQDTGPILSRMAFDNKAREAAFNAASNQTAAAKRSAAEAREYAKKAGMSMEEQRLAFKAIQDDPSLSIFAGKGGLNLTKDPAKTTSTLTNFIMESKTEDAKRWMDHLKQTDPTAHAIFVENIIGNNLQDFLVQSKTGGQATTANIKAVRNYIEGKDSERFKKLSAIIGPEYTNRFNAFMKAIPALDDALMYGNNQNTSKAIGNLYGIISGVKRAAQGQDLGFRSQQANIAQKVGALIANGAYRTIAKSITNPKAADWLWNVSRPFADGVASLPAQQAIIMLNDRRLIDEQARLQANQPAQKQQ
jgi:hypothetical protein